MANAARVATTERQAHRATVSVVLVCSFTLTVVHTGRSITDVRRTLTLREFEAAVAALEERALRSAIHAVREHFQHFFLLFFCSGTSVIRATLAAAVRNFASLADTLLVFEIRAFKHDKARRAVEANLAN
jgi:Na+/alanine symporter